LLLKITNKCKMNCSHCGENSNINGEHMTNETFENALKFIKRTKTMVVIITGGEPTEHPNFIEMVSEIQKNTKIAILCSNGMFLENEEITNKIKKLKVNVQITNDSRYYPSRIKKINIDNFKYEDTLRSISPFGRAIVNSIPSTTTVPCCFNFVTNYIRSGSLEQTLYGLTVAGKFCTPSINVDGTILAGEFNPCYSFGYVTDDNTTLYNNICKFNCNKCNLFNEAYHKLLFHG
jgi:hypothetical protein